MQPIAVPPPPGFGGGGLLLPSLPVLLFSPDAQAKAIARRANHRAFFMTLPDGQDSFRARVETCCQPEIFLF
ncbi:MAG TPA: hypothetical protein VKN99_24925 [Polyangia bacterium]|nr:hypothetical protein [Polyangia bacterium]